MPSVIRLAENYQSRLRFDRGCVNQDFSLYNQLRDKVGNSFKFNDAVLANVCLAII